jgi:hypothetical protein
MRNLFLLGLAAVAATLVASRALPSGARAATAPTYGTLLRFDFDEGPDWPDARAEAPSGGRAVVSTSARVGTIDVADSTEPSKGVLLTVSGTPKEGKWRASLSSGPLAVANRETDVRKLTLAFSLSASAARPVTVVLESFDATKKRTGGLAAVVYPAAPDFHQRFAVDLGTMRASGAGKFEPTAPFVGVRFEIGSASDWSGEANPEIRLDNVHYAAPAYYVAPSGSDANDGRAEKTAFATPQKALDVAGPGDIVLVMEGTYQPRDVQEGVACFRRAGTPAAWVTLKNYPGQKPRFAVVNTWNAIRIGQRGKQDAPSPLPALAYLEIRGLHFRGDSDVAKEKYAEFLGKADPRTNGNATTITGRFETNPPHHIRVADNLMEFCAGGGTGSGECDWVTVEDNVIRNNCWWMIYAGSGISLLGATNFDAAANVYKCLVRNNIVSGNRCFLPWKQIGKVSDGNGIIIDSNHDPGKKKTYLGRTLVQNNLSFNNGGSGIHSFKSHQVDIINNTAYLNGASPELKWGQIFLQKTADARVVNNILWAREGQPVNTVGPNTSDKDNTQVVRASNLYFGGTTPIMGAGDVIADPLFVRPSTDPAAADFRLQPNSPAIRAGRREPFAPPRDLDGKPRGAQPARGAYEP